MDFLIKQNRNITLSTFGMKIFGLLLTILLICNGFLYANEYNNKIEYNVFFSEYENYFLFKPELIKTIFWGIVDIKPKYVKQRKAIDHQIFSCSQMNQNKTCYYEQFLLSRKAQKIPSSILIPVVFKNITSTKVNRQKKLVRLQWEAESFNSPEISKNQFLHQINFANDGYFYQAKPEIKVIRFNLVLPRSLSITMRNNVAENLIGKGIRCGEELCSGDITGVYQQIPDDYKDFIYLHYREVDITYSESAMSVNVYLRASKVKINHQIYSVTY